MKTTVKQDNRRPRGEGDANGYEHTPPCGNYRWGAALCWLVLVFIMLVGLSYLVVWAADALTEDLMNFHFSDGKGLGEDGW